MAFSSDEVIDPLAGIDKSLEETLNITDNSLDSLPPPYVASYGFKEPAFVSDPLAPHHNTNERLTSSELDVIVGGRPPLLQTTLLGATSGFENESLASPKAPETTIADNFATAAGPSSSASPAVFEPRSVSRAPEAEAGPSTHEEQPDHPPAALLTTDAPVHVRVKEAQKMEGTSKLGLRQVFYSYIVQTDCRLPGFIAEGVTVRRRFSEFEALQRLLRWQYRGFVIPPLPEKSFLEGKLGHEEFLRSRQADLQTFLKGVVSHPALQQSEPVKLFLLQPGEIQYNPAWIQLLQQAQLAKQATVGYAALPADDAGGGGAGPMAQGKALGAGFGNLVSWVRQAVFQPAKREMDDEETALRRSKVLLKDLERLLQLSAEAARTLTARLESLGADFGELGRNMAMLGRWEETLQQQQGTYTEAGHSAQKRSVDCRRLAAAGGRQQQIWANISVKASASLVTLHDYYVLVPEAIAALEERETLWAEIGVLEDDLAAKLAAMAQLGNKSSPGSAGDRRQQALGASVERLEEQLRAARELYREIRRRNQQELLRLQLSREVDFRRMMAAFAAGQAQLVQVSADLWRSAAQQFAADCE